MTARKTKTDLFCRNADGDIVVLAKVWMGHSKTYAAVSLYVVRGKKDKFLRLTHREMYPKTDYTKEMLLNARDTGAHLWALQNEVSDYVVVYTEPKMVDMYHPSQLQQESQP